MLTGHERIHILRAINPEADFSFMNVLLEPGGSAFAYWQVPRIGAVVSFGIDLDDQCAWHPSIEFQDPQVAAFKLDDAMAVAIADRLRAIWPFFFEELKLAADREARYWADEEAREIDREMEWAELDAEVYETHLEMRAADGPF